MEPIKTRSNWPQSPV